MTFRFAAEADLDTLVQLNLELLAADCVNYLPADEVRRRLAQFLAAGHTAVLFEMHAAVVGYALYSLGHRSEDEKIVYLRHFLVHTAYRRRGYGRHAFGWLAEYVWPRDAHICLDVKADNSAALSFWQTLGFKTHSLTLQRSRP